VRFASSDTSPSTMVITVNNRAPASYTDGTQLRLGEAISPWNGDLFYRATTVSGGLPVHTAEVAAVEFTEYLQ